MKRTLLATGGTLQLPESDSAARLGDLSRGTPMETSEDQGRLDGNYWPMLRPVHDLPDDCAKKPLPIKPELMKNPGPESSRDTEEPDSRHDAQSMRRRSAGGVVLAPHHPGAVFSRDVSWVSSP
jgi:hypothetical protein